MEDLWRIRGAVLDTDDLADQATYQRLLRGSGPQRRPGTVAASFTAMTT
jgi:hypothetical protein